MTTLTDKLTITMRVADLPDFTINIRREEEEAYRKIQKEINRMWENWMKSAPEMTSHGIMAFIAIKFAKKLYDTAIAMNHLQADTVNRQNDINTMLADFESEIDKILLDIGEQH